MSREEYDAAAFMFLASMMLLNDDDEDPVYEALRLADYDQAADFLDGTARTGNGLDHAERWWEKSGRHLSNAQFRTAFRCRCVEHRDTIPYGMI